MKTELLIVVPDNDLFCSNKKSFVEFLKIDSQISIVDSKVSYKKDLKSKDIVAAKFRVETDKVQSKQERYFLLVLECEDELLVDEFNELCERIKTVCERISPNSTAVNTLWDDVGHIYARLSYPLINEVENLMRRMIAKFMLITVGMSWSQDVMQPELLKKIENSDDGQPLLNDLHKLDFIHLNQVLFEKKRDIGLDELDRVLLKTKFSEDDKAKILKYTPRSNWEKYFSKLIDEKDTSVEKKWELLYKLRNKVAHNRHVTKLDYEQIQGLASAIKEIISKATAKLGEIDLTREDRELIIHSYNSNSATAVEYLAERSVADYYMADGYGVEMLEGMRTNQYPFDFLLNKDSQKHGVEVVAIRSNNFHSYITMIESRARHKDIIRTSAGSVLESMHLIFVITNEYTDLEYHRMLRQADKFAKILGEGYELYFGELNSQNIYLPLSNAHVYPPKP